MQTRIGAVLGALFAPLVAIVAAPAPAHADAEHGVCAKGERLGSYSTSQSAKNWAGETIYVITIRKRWCYNLGTKRVGSAYSPKPSIDVKGEFNASWSSSIIDSDAYFTNVDAKGGKHPNYPRWGHVSWYTVKMCHNVVGKLGCVQSHNEKVGIIGYWDGSKKLA